MRSAFFDKLISVARLKTLCSIRVAGRKKGEVVSQSTKGPSEEVAKNGIAEAKAGFSSLVGKSTSV